MRTNLVLARVGRKSLHSGWLAGAGDRNWDIALAPFEPISEPARRGCDVAGIVPGPKWSGLRELLHSWDRWREYDYVWLPDDDIEASLEAISQMFDIARALDLDLFAPGLDERSYYAHYSTMSNRSFYGRWVGFVEIMVPGFSSKALEKLLFTLDLGDTGWGRGLDSVCRNYLATATSRSWMRSPSPTPARWG